MQVYTLILESKYIHMLIHKDFWKEIGHDTTACACPVYVSKLIDFHKSLCVYKCSNEGCLE